MGLIRARLDGGVDCSHLGKRCGSQLSGEGGLGAGPGVVNRTGLFPVTGTIAKNAMVKRGRPFGGFHDV
ncbi:MAG TPA: hypothetical protein VFY54_05945, partial [Rubrobacter sp.]|nr:hypothetical protein [Rubrobacter sp.]